ncbi:Nucleolar pre-ribosomal-associated protein 1-like protein [Drosera capensis]
MAAPADPVIISSNHENDSDDAEMETEETMTTRFNAGVSGEAHLRQLLTNLNSKDPKLGSDSAKELTKLIKNDSKGELLSYYVKMSANLVEIRDSWKARRGKPEMAVIMGLVTAILDHPEGKYSREDSSRAVVSKGLDRFGKLIVEECLGDVYKELNSRDWKKQRRALRVVTSVVRRGSGLADEVAKGFDFKIPVLGKLAGWRKKKRRGKKGEVEGKSGTRNAFIEFAMSFLEMGKPGLVRWVLQQKELFSGVLRGLGSDEAANVVYVLGTLRDRVLVPESLVPPGLRSVLFGSAMLEQMASISGREGGDCEAEAAAYIAHDVLLKACTDPSNGLMPDMKTKSLKGNPKRLLGLMKKLKAIEVKNHRGLLVAIVRGTPFLGSAYLDEFPHNLEDHSSATWVDSASLAADIVSSVSTDISWDFLDHLSQKESAIQDSDLQSVLKCICPSPFGRLVINKGLLHSSALVKHGTLRLLLENLKLLHSLIDALNSKDLISLRREIQNEVRVLLPDPQVFFGLLNSLSNKYNSYQSSLKRKSSPKAIEEEEKEKKKKKKLKADVPTDEIDIVVGGLNFDGDLDLQHEGDNKVALRVKDADDGNNHRWKFGEVWRLNRCSTSSSPEDNADVYFHCKLLEVLQIYFWTLHSVSEVSYDFFKMIPGDLLALPSTLLRSLLSLLEDYVSQPSKFGVSCGSLPPFYKYLHHFLGLLLYSPIREIKDQAFDLARGAMLSTGAFDSNEPEVGAWFLFLPGYNRDSVHIEDQECELFHKLSPVIVSFLCDVVSSVGNNLILYWERVKSYSHHSENSRDLATRFSPLVICVLEKCLRLLSAQSTTFTLPERTMISLYVSNTLKYVIQTQVEPKLLSYVIHQFLSERSEDGFLAAGFDSISCEWRSLNYLFYFSQCISEGGGCVVAPSVYSAPCSNGSFVDIISEVETLMNSGCDSQLVGVSKAFYFALICAAPNEIMKSLPSVLQISDNLLGIRSLLLSLLFLDPSLSSSINKLSRTSTVGEQNDNDSVNVVFLSLLSEAPFHVLLSAFVIGGDHEHYSRMRELLSDRLSELATDLLYPSLMFSLFCIHQKILSLGQDSVDESQNILEVCYTLLEHTLQVLPLKADVELSNDGRSSVSFRQCMHIWNTIFSHPAFTSAFPYGDESVEELLQDILEVTECLSREKLCRKGRPILSLLSVACGSLFGMCSRQKPVTANGKDSDQSGKPLKHWVQRVLKMIRERLDLYVGTLNLTFAVPALYIIFVSMHFLPPFDLLELAHWLLSKADPHDQADWRTSKVSPYHVGFSIAGGALGMLSRSSWLPNSGGAQNDFFLESNCQSSDALVLESIFFKAVDFSTRYKLEAADSCLLKLASAARRSEHRQDLLPFCMRIAMGIASTPIKLLHHCIDNINPSKSQLLLYSIETSPLHMSAFGQVLLETLKDNSMGRSGKCRLSDDGYLMLLPAALSYISSALTKFGSQYARKLDKIPSLYSSILVAGFTNWKNFIYQDIFQLESVEVLPSSCEQLLDLVNNSILGKAVNMLQYHLTLNKAPMDECLRFFLSICPSSELLDFNMKEKHARSVHKSLDSVNRTVAMISLSKILLFPSSCQNQFHPEEKQDDDGQPDALLIRERSSRLRFIDSLVSIWRSIAEEIPSACGTSLKKNKGMLFFNFLEVFILRSINRLIMEMHDALVQLDSLPFLEEIFKVSLRHRFEDPDTLESLRCMISVFSEGNLPTVSFLKLLLGHSHLGSTIQTVGNSGCCDAVGVLLKPISSILRSVFIPTEMETPTNSSQKLEVIKLLGILFHLKSHQRGPLPEDDIGINTRELLCLLLSSYGATHSDVDLEIYSLMVEIESAEMGCGKLAELDFLWGSALLRTTQDEAHESDSLPYAFLSEMNEDSRRGHFRDNLPIDPKLCIETVLHFPFERTTSLDPLSCEMFLQMNGKEPKIPTARGERIKCYDPVFILRFSIHCLSMDFLDSVEFAGLGLLAIALMSISSPDDNIRKLGYEVIGKFMDGLEKCRKKRDSTRLRLLLTYLQNGIQEPWQKIPSTIALFIAESSLILLDSSNDRHAAINMHLMQPSRINMKVIPFFHDYFWSSSVNFKKDRIWMLSLLCAGINSEEDSRLFIKGSVPEILLSFYVSPLSDNESKDLILQILEKSVKFQNMSFHLVKSSSLVSWITSVLSSLSSRGDQDTFFLKQLTILLEVTNCVVSSRRVSEWLQTHALEQLSDLSFNLHKILVNSSKHFGNISSSKLVEKDALLISMLRVIVSTLQLSHKKEVHKPHYKLSVRDLYDLYLAIHDSKGSSCAELALKVVLMSTPQVTIFDLDQKELSSFLSWAVSTAVRSNSAEMHQQKECSPYSSTHANGDECGESCVSKLIRWLSASAILGSISCKRSNGDFSFLSGVQNLDGLLSFLKCFEKECKGTKKPSGSTKTLAAVIFHLQQLLGVKCKVLRSAVAALSLLLLTPGSSSITSPGSPLSSLCSRIHNPPELNPMWRWSYDLPLADASSEETDMERLDELHACQSLLLILSEHLEKIASNYQRLSYHDLENSGVFQWERSIIEIESCT